MAMDYSAMHDTAESLLDDFGTSMTLSHDTGETEYDPETMTDTKVYEEYTGIGVKLDYSSEAIGSNDNIIQAGDVKIICQFDIEPVEDKDRITAGGISFNIIQCGKVEPDAQTAVIYTLQCRKATS